MKIGFGITLRGLTDPDSAAELGASIFRYLDGRVRLAINDIQSNECTRLFELFLEQQCEIQSCNFSLKSQETLWVESDSTCLGAILLPDELIRIDPSNTFEPRLPSPCYGFVPEDMPIRVCEMPQGHIVGVNDHEVFSTELSEFFMRHDKGITAPVILNGEKVAGWQRYTPQSVRRIVNVEVLQSYHCGACGTQGVSNPIVWGVWLGRGTIDCDICRDERGIGHLGLVRPYLISRPTAQLIIDKFKSGFAIQPILDSESRCGNKMVELLNRLAVHDQRLFAG